MNTARLKSIKELRAYLKDELLRSREFPPDSRFQLGFEAALEEVARMVDPEGYDRRRSWWLCGFKNERIVSGK